jgi:Single-strand binding protein family
MSARAIVSGVLFKAPASKTSKAGKPYVVATIREGSGERVRWWKAFVFSESAIDEVLKLEDGEPIAVAGEFDCEIYAPPGGEPRISCRITADTVLSAHAKRKPKPEKSTGEATSEQRTGRILAAASWAAPTTSGGAHDGDDIPF